MAPNNKNQHYKGNRSANTRRDQSKFKPNRGSTKTDNRHYGCGLCNADHRLVSCKKFNNLNLAQKYRKVLNLHYCINCLARNHLLASCTNKSRCGVCRQKHHTVLHGHRKILKGIQKEPNSQQASSSKRSSAQRLQGQHEAKTAVLGLPSSSLKTLVPTAEVYIATDNGLISVRALLNPSLTTSRISSVFVHEHKLDVFKLEGKSFVKLIVNPNMNSIIKYDICMLVVKELPKKPYTSPFNEVVKAKFGNLSLADPNFDTNSSVLMELGGDVYTRILKPNVIHVDGGSLLAQDTTLGWLIMGSFSG